MINLNPVKGSEQAGYRPALVVSDEVFNQTLPVVTVIPITSYKKGRIIYPAEVLLLSKNSGLPKDSIAMAHQIRTISKKRLNVSYGEILDNDKKNEIRNALRIHLDL